MAELDELTYEAVEDEDSLFDQKWVPSEAAHARDEDAACEDDCEDERELGLTQAEAAAVGAAEDFDEVGARLVEDNAGRRMWEFAVEVDLGDTHISGGAFVDACTGEIVLFDYESGGNG